MTKTFWLIDLKIIFAYIGPAKKRKMTYFHMKLVFAEEPDMTE